jgi:inner membrane protein
MEPVTHLLTGACISRAGINRKTGWATFALVIAAEAADLDMLWDVRGPVAALEHHRGITHSLIAAPFMALAVVGFTALVAAAWGRIRRKKVQPRLPIHWGWLWFGALLADLSHLALDYTNSYGLRPFKPFNMHWYAWSIVSIFDPWIFGVLVLALVIPALLKLTDQEIGDRRRRFRGRGWAWFALIFVLLYWSVRNAEHLHAEALLRNGSYMTAPMERVAAEPTMADPFRWVGLVETPNAFRIVRIDTASKQLTLSPVPVYKPAVTPAVAAAKQCYLGRIYLDWAKWPVVEDMGEIPIPGAPAPPQGAHWHAVQFRDLRYARRPGGNPPLSGWVYVKVAGGQPPQVEAMYLDGHLQP